MQMINEADLGITASDILNQDYQNRCLQWKPIPLSKDQMPVVVSDIPVVETEKLENVLWEDLRKPRGTGELVMMRDYLDADNAEPSAGIRETVPAVMQPMQQVEPIVETGVRIAENRGEEMRIVKTSPKTDGETGETGETGEEIVETENYVGERMDSERQTEELNEEEEEEELVIVVEFDRTGEHVDQREPREPREPGEQTEGDKDKEEEDKEEGKEEKEEEGGGTANSNGNNSLNEKKTKKELKKEKKEQKRREKEEKKKKKKKKKEERNPKESIVVDSCVITMPEFR